jgi:fimbrial chaperone protein
MQKQTEPMQKTRQNAARLEVRFRRFVRATNPLLLTTICAFAGVRSTKAQTIGVQPVNLVLHAGQKITTLTLNNPSTEPITLQARAFTWGQDGNNDPLNPSEAVLISPPMATIGPGETQIIRVAVRQPAVSHEATYRLLIDQLPQAAHPKAIAILLRLSIPLFVEASPNETAKLEFRVTRNPDGKPSLVVTNGGLCHDSIREIHLKASDGTTWKVNVPGLPYVLAGAQRSWPIVAEGATRDLPNAFTLTAQTDVGPITRQVSVSGAP